MRRRRLLLGSAVLGLVVALFLGSAVQVRQGAGARAITIGPWTRFLVEEPSLYLRLHEAAHRRQYRLGGWRSWLAYAFDFDTRLRMEAEADALARCAQGIVSTPGPESWARSRMHETIYAFWWWERGGPGRRDHVGEWLAAHDGCRALLEELDEDGRLAWQEAESGLAAARGAEPAPPPRPARVGPVEGAGTPSEPVVVEDDGEL